ncbi:VOC family protein [Ignisphaera sp. 4213-co]|uniref:VOC family protein n=1 Tax=Ignisphaera cupida TaxID=3050454 RepID=A0ABD4Z906_9CREN|nr:VOC family protein [Ignisphaera sp. 4213-co]MDK6029385.1 VOC family protein [Ignisphaera sp. 4213-co]
MSCKGLGKVVQIAIVVRNIDEALENWSKLLGIEKPKVIVTEEWEKTKMMFRGEPSRGRAKLAFINMENIVIELIEPIDGPSTWRDFLEKHGQGIHHIAFVVENADECAKYLEGFGGFKEQEGFFRNGKYIYVNTVNGLGAIIELLQYFSK